MGQCVADGFHRPHRSGYGQVVGWIDLTGLLDSTAVSQPVDVLNGIAYDAETDHLYVTGKWWPRLFEIEVIPLPKGVIEETALKSGSK